MPRERYSRGSLYKSETKPQKWLGEWYVYDAQDKRRHKGPVILGFCSKLSKSEAQAELDRRIAESRSTADQKPNGEITLDWLMRQYLELHRPTWEEKFAGYNVWLFNKHLLPAFAGRTASSVTRSDLQAYLNDLAASGRSKSLITKIRLYLRCVFAEAVEDDHIPKDPSRKLLMPKCKPVVKRVLTDDECALLLDAAKSFRDRLIFRMLMVMGLRPSELFALKRDDVEPGRIRIDDANRNGKLTGGTKTDDSKGYVSLAPQLEAELAFWLDTSKPNQMGLIFPSAEGTPIDHKNFLNRNLKPAAASVGLSGVDFRALRRTTATLVPSVGGSVKDAQAILRHASPQMTAGVYMQSIPKSVSDAVAALDEKLRKPVVQ